MDKRSLDGSILSVLPFTRPLNLSSMGGEERGVVLVVEAQGAMELRSMDLGEKFAEKQLECFIGKR